MTKKKPVYLILSDVRSSQNVGAIFRTADGAGVDKIILAGITPAPKDKFGRVNPKIAKTALGAEKIIPWESVSSVSRAINNLKKGKFFVVALEQSKNSIDYKKLKPKYPLALIVGNEISGVPKNILKKCDAIIEIPMRGQKESLNVSVAMGVALFRILKV